MPQQYLKNAKHVFSIAAAFEFEAGTEIIDIGTGGGFPGIPLAIFFPECKFHLVDSIAKKIKVVDAIAKSIDLKNITTQHIRAEEIKNRKPAHPGGGFDFAVSRAVAPLKDLWNWSKPLIRHKAQGISKQAPGLICLKGGDLSKEIQESGIRPRIMEISGIF